MELIVPIVNLQFCRQIISLVNRNFSSIGIANLAILVSAYEFEAVGRTAIDLGIAPKM